MLNPTPINTFYVNFIVNNLENVAFLSSSVPNSLKIFCDLNFTHKKESHFYLQQFTFSSLFISLPFFFLHHLFLPNNTDFPNMKSYF
jgi:hypothetical protein